MVKSVKFSKIIKVKPVDLKTWAGFRPAWRTLEVSILECSQSTRVKEKHKIGNTTELNITEGNLEEFK
jgi:hypothetical protein